MSGSSEQLAALPRPLRLLARTLAVAALVLGSFQVIERALVVSLIPLYRATIGVLDDSFVLTEVALSHHGSDETLRFRANLSRPLEVEGQTLYPFGWNALIPAGGIEVHCSLGGVLQYPALALIVALAWPTTAKELLARLVLFLPLALLLLLIDIPSTVLAELWNSLERMVNPNAISRWMIWSRFLMGGGGLLFGLVAAGMDILLAKWILGAIAPRKAPAPQP
jgi:hypothetical protein